jgi:hypothetical protein
MAASEEQQTGITQQPADRRQQQLGVAQRRMLMYFLHLAADAQRNRAGLRGCFNRKQSVHRVTPGTG